MQTAASGPPLIPPSRYVGVAGGRDAAVGDMFWQRAGAGNGTLDAVSAHLPMRLYWA